MTENRYLSYGSAVFAPIPALQNILSFYGEAEALAENTRPTVTDMGHPGKDE